MFNLSIAGLLVASKWVAIYYVVMAIPSVIYGGESCILPSNWPEVYLGFYLGLCALRVYSVGKGTLNIYRRMK